MVADDNQLKAAMAIKDTMVTATMTATGMATATVQQRWQQQSTTSSSKRNGGGGRGNGGSGRNGGNAGRNCGGSSSSCCFAPVKGRGDDCCNQCCQVSAATTTISAAAAWTPWFKYSRLEGLFEVKFYFTSKRPYVCSFGLFQGLCGERGGSIGYYDAGPIFLR
jgi:hypothetical protein